MIDAIVDDGNAAAADDTIGSFEDDGTTPTPWMLRTTYVGGATLRSDVGTAPH